MFYKQLNTTLNKQQINELLFVPLFWDNNWFKHKHNKRSYLNTFTANTTLKFRQKYNNLKTAGCCGAAINFVRSEYFTFFVLLVFIELATAPFLDHSRQRLKLYVSASIQTTNTITPHDTLWISLELWQFLKNRPQN